MESYKTRTLAKANKQAIFLSEGNVVHWRTETNLGTFTNTSWQVHTLLDTQKTTTNIYTVHTTRQTHV